MAEVDSAGSVSGERRRRETVAMTTLNWTDGVSQALSCVVVGGYPPPSIIIQINTSVDISDQFTMSQSATLDGVRGLRVMTYISERSEAVTHTHLAFYTDVNVIFDELASESVVLHTDVQNVKIKNLKNVINVKCDKYK